MNKLTGGFLVLVMALGIVWFLHLMTTNTPSVEQGVHRCLEKCKQSAISEYHYTMADGPSCVCAK